MNTKGINIGGKTYYTVCVHDHRFHSDDVFAVALLEQLFLQFELQQDDGVQHVARLSNSLRGAVLPHQLPLPVIRVSSNHDEAFFKNLEATNVLCVDVGKGRYDHHQMDAQVHIDGARYCGLSLIWEQVLSDNRYITGDMRKFCSIIENDIIYAIEAADNGVKPCALSHLIEFRNPANPGQNADTAFVEAVRIAMKIIGPFLSQISRDVTELNECLTESSHLQSMGLASRRVAIANKSFRPRILTAAFPWANLVLYPDFRNGKFTYVLRSIDDVDENGINHNRWTVPVEFRDKTKWSELLDNYGIPDPIFVHPNGFLVTFDSLTPVAAALMDERFTVATDWGAARESLPAATIPAIMPLKIATKEEGAEESSGLQTREAIEELLKEYQQ